MHAAAARGDVDLIVERFSQGESVSATDPHGKV